MKLFFSQNVFSGFLTVVETVQYKYILFNCLNFLMVEALIMIYHSLFLKIRNIIICTLYTLLSRFIK